MKQNVAKIYSDRDEKVDNNTKSLQNRKFINSNNNAIHNETSNIASKQQTTEIGEKTNFKAGKNGIKIIISFIISIISKKLFDYRVEDDKNYVFYLIIINKIYQEYMKN